VGGYSVDAAARSVNGVSYDLILVFYGWEPCVGFADALGLHRSAQGFIATDMQTAQTSCPGVYAIGEVAQRQHPCVVTALADGVTAAKAIQAKIEAGQ
jgi:thioredoxin reductase